MIRALLMLLAVTSAAHPDDLRPVSLADWSGAPPAFVADDHRFELSRVSAQFASHHDHQQLYRGAGASVLVEGWVSPPDPRAIMGGRATLALDDVVDHRGRNLITPERRVESRPSMGRFQRGTGGARRPGFAVRVDVVGCGEVPAGLRSLRGRVSFPIVESVERVRVPAVVGDELVEVHPGVSVRVTDVARRPEQVRITADYAIRNADDGYDRKRPPFLLDVHVVEAGGERPPSQSWTKVGNQTLLHTGMHGAVRATAKLGADRPAPALELELITAIRTVEIPFHFTDIGLSQTPPDDDVDESRLRRYGPDEAPGPRVVEQDDIMLTLSSLESKHARSFLGDRGLTSWIGGNFNLRLPPGVWAHAYVPTITAIVDHLGAPVAFEQRPQPRRPGLLSYFRTVAAPRSHDVRASFQCDHTRPPLAGISEIRGVMPVRRASRVESVELKWAALEEREVLPGLSIALGEPEGADGAMRMIPIKVVRESEVPNAGLMRLPYVIGFTAVAADGSELRTQNNMLRNDEFEKRTLQRGQLSVTPGEDGPEPARLRLEVVIEVEDIEIPISFTDLPLRVDR